MILNLLRVLKTRWKGRSCSELSGLGHSFLDIDLLALMEN